YLQAIAKGEINALNNLANLYSEQGKLEEAEQYYLQAIAKGEIDASYNLALLYLKGNTQKGNAYERIKDLEVKDDQALVIKIILEVWNNIFENLDKRVAELAFNAEPKHVNFLLIYLLYFEQEQLVLSLFHQEEKGNVLREKYILLYYATLLLTNQMENNLELRIPPEVQSTVEAIVAEVKEKQRFYA
ncbi:hypothetical protein BWI93_07615, partial [Siphonobacter sp. BAB-5385]|uniref:tetratricopeptide repeat protein n=1 Tax=Siphonobacter sp. BAB-5385 TaxID=1864822 RepID=UPI000BC45047